MSSRLPVLAQVWRSGAIDVDDGSPFMVALVINRDNVTTTRAAGSPIGVHEPNRKPCHHRISKIETSWMVLLAHLTREVVAPATNKSPYS
jgi:hypothetical protein